MFQKAGWNWPHLSMRPFVQAQRTNVLSRDLRVRARRSESAIWMQTQKLTSNDRFRHLGRIAAKRLRQAQSNAASAKLENPMTTLSA